jgi:hypothetical protein
MIAFITLTNNGYVDFTLNCLKSLENINFEKKLDCYCIGEECCSILKSNSYNSFLIKDDNSNFQTFRNGNWWDIVSNKFKIIHENLNKYDFVCITDGDIVFENNKFLDYLIENIEDNDMLIQNDTMNDNDHWNLCSGFMFLKSNEKTRYLFNPKIVIEKYKEKICDQLYINNIKNKLKYKLLPLELFPNGRYYYENHSKIQPYLIHFNWLIGHEKKKKMKEFNKWYLD